MENPAPPNRLIQYACYNCGLPFHVRLKPGDEAAPFDEARLNCPGCNADLMVRVPRRLVKQGEIVKSFKPPDAAG